MTHEELEREVHELKARAAADTAFLRCAIFTLSTPQLRGAVISMEKLAEEMAVSLLYMNSASDAANHAFEERKQFWLSALHAEVSARELAEKP